MIDRYYKDKMPRSYIDFHVHAFAMLMKQINTPMGIYTYETSKEIVPLHQGLEKMFGSRAKIIDTEGELLHQVEQGAFMASHCFDKVMPQYLELLVKAPQEVRDFFIANNRHGNVALRHLNPVLDQFSQEDVVEIFTNDNLHLPAIDSEFSKTLCLLKKRPGYQQLIKQYLQKKCREKMQIDSRFSIRNTLISELPNDLEHFKVVPGMQFFLEAKQEELSLFNEKSSIFQPGRFISLEIDYYALKHQDCHTAFTMEHYDGLLVKFLKTLNDLAKEPNGLDINQVHTNSLFANSHDITKPWDRYRDFSLFLRRDSTLNIDDVKAMVGIFLEEGQWLIGENNLSSGANKDKLERDFIKKWLESYTMDSKLNTEQHKSMKRHKI